MVEYHRPALLGPTLAFLDPRPGDTFLDGTLGGGGHAEAILEKIVPGGRLIGLDRDQDAIDYASQRLRRFGDAFIPVKANFAAMDSVLAGLGTGKVQGILLDLGISSHTVDEPGRGFSFLQDGPLDLRMDRSQPLTAADVVNQLPERELAELIRRDSDERWAARIAKRIVEQRARKPLTRTGELADLVAAAIPRGAWPERTHPSTRTFLALRIVVNAELDALRDAIPRAVSVLAPGRRFAVLTYHSLEDRMVKQAFADLAGRCKCPPDLPVCACEAAARVRLITRKPVRPDEGEISENPRARSAKLRVVEALG